LIDLDTIDVSNLNRQFLFRPEHVGQPKAVVAGKAAMAFNPDLKVVSYHDNIKSTRFNLAYFEKFNLVLNALDNIDARRHVNRLCLAANVPLIDSGTTGYLGQVMPIIKGKTSCYECFPKPTQKVYPICTIRSTPDKPVHCIVWAKECFKLLFNQPSESMLFEDTSSGETSTYMHLIKFPTDLSVESILAYGRELLLALYNTEIDKRLRMDVYKTAKVVPAPLSVEEIDLAVETTRAVLTGSSAPRNTSAGWDQRVYTLQENLMQFLTCLHEVAHKDYALLGQLSFDKDDLWAMKFVTAASNLRSFVFTIPLLSFHDAKGVAGNIIPAIATTNAIVAGVQVMQAVRLLTQPRALEGKGLDVIVTNTSTMLSVIIIPWMLSSQILPQCYR
jgi:ubiquitin-like 1-activating enzyme E1 B